MRNIDNTQNERAETGQIILSLLGVLLKDASQKELQWLDKSHEVNESEHLQEIVLEALIEENQFWDGTNHIKEEITGKVVYRNGLNLLKSSCSLHEVQDDLEKVDDINGPLDVLKGLLARVFRISEVLIGDWVLVLVDIWEHNNKWRDEHAVDGQNGNQKVPNFTEGPLSVDEVPFEFWLILIDSAVLVGILVDVIDHHLLQVGLCHLLESGLESQLIVVTSCLHPKLFNTLLLLF